MKTNWIQTCLLAAALLALPAVVQAQFTYTTNNGTITITGYTGSGGAVTIPATINGLPVTNIGSSAFYDCSLTSVTIPDSVFSIGDGAFASDGLTSVTIPNSVTNIGSNAFAVCGLTNVTIPNSVTSIGVYAFADCGSLTAITVAAQNPVYSSVDGVLFNKNQTILVEYPPGGPPSYTIPDSVTNIWKGAFLDCENLTSVSIDNGVISIGDYAFNNCQSLTSVMIGTGLTSIGDSAFEGCENLNGIFFAGNAPSVDEYEFSANNLTIYYVSGTTGWSSLFAGFATALWDPPTRLGYAINNGAVTIIGYASGGAVTIPVTINGLPVTSIGDYAFANDDPPLLASLTNVTIGNSVINIGNWAFYGCYNLTSVTIPDSVSNIGNDAFSRCGLTSVTIPNSVINIGGSAFGCPSLTNIFFVGNAPPNVSPHAFSWFLHEWYVWVDDPATAYYLPGTTGWVDFSANTGLPTALWLPQAQTSDASFGVQNHQFGFKISWASGETVVVEACSNLTNPVWQPVQTNTLTSDSVYFSDPQWANYPARFYRLRSP